MHRYTFQFFYSFFFFSISLIAQTPYPIHLDSLVNKLGSDYLTTSGAPGLSIGVYANEKSSFYNFGTTESGKQIKPSQNSIYEIGSNSKTFTCLLLAQAVIEKRVKLDDDIRNYLKGNYPNLEFKGQPIQLVHLANQTSGLPDNIPDLSSIMNKNVDSIPDAIIAAQKNFTKQNFYDALHQVTLDTIPGYHSKHSNAAAQLLAYIIEGIYGRSYESLLKNNILSPLGMHNTIVLPLKETHLPFSTKGYNENKKATPSVPPNMALSAGLGSSTFDMISFLKFQLNIKSEAVRLTHQATRHDPNGEEVGLNWWIGHAPGEILQYYYSGGTFGYSSVMVFYPEQQVAIVLLSNESDRSAEDNLYFLTEKIIAALKH
jgi:D-alanyl-D-alanine-carboxypeptidase/D-alanyl-D-alanine-endopeptidase